MVLGWWQGFGTVKNGGYVCEQSENPTKKLMGFNGMIWKMNELV
jgi:hypothetical protein